MTDIHGKRVLLTGGASGIGRLLAAELGAAGARLVLWDIDEQGLQSVRAELRASGFDVEASVCDVSDRNAVAKAAEDLLSRDGAVDILINNAGIVSGESILELSDADIERTFDVNVLALFRTVRAFLPAMLERDAGHIVTIASAAGLAGTARLTDYCASKFAAVGFDESLRLELRNQGSNIVTTIVCPYYTDTGMFDGAKTRFSLLLPILKPEALVRRIMKAIRKDRRRVIMPWFLYTGFPMRLLPVPWLDALMDFFGASRSMDQFRGKQSD